jgi:GT2 family glycosyltransferase
MAEKTDKSGVRPLVSIIILNYNGLAHSHLPDCLASLHCQTYAALEIIVVDNASPDDSTRFVEAHYPQVHLIKNGQNTGFCMGNNTGYAQATGRFIFFLNNDTLVMPDCIEQLVAAAQRHPQAGVLSPKLVRPLPTPTSPQQIDSAGLLLRSDLTLRDRGFSANDEKQFNQPAFLFAACGAALFIRRETAEAVQVNGRLWDETFVAYYEDGELCWRVQNRGWRCLYFPTAVVVHKRGGASPASFFQKPPHFQVHTIKNRYLMIIKNSPWRLLVRQLPFLLVRDLLIWGYLILHPPVLLNTIRALSQTVPHAWQQRAKTPPRTTATELFTIQPNLDDERSN